MTPIDQLRHIVECEKDDYKPSAQRSLLDAPALLAEIEYMQGIIYDLLEYEGDEYAKERARDCLTTKGEKNENN